MAPEERDEEGSSGADEELTGREFAVQLGRDIVVAVVIIAIALAVVFVYTGNWPPEVVVESGSMQHSSTRSYLGVIDTGDLVLVQSVNADPNNVVTYVQGRVSGYETYSNYGDVIVFHPPGAGEGVTPIIHRAMVYVEFPSAVPGSGLVDIPTLAPFPVSEWDGTDAGGNPTHNTTGLKGIAIQLRTWHTGSESIVTLSYTFSSASTRGFLTKGDHNPDFDRVYDGSGRPPVPASAIVGKARGEIPWFGLIKLTVSPTTTGCCRRGWGDPAAPQNSWDSLTTSFVLIPLGIFLADYGLAFGERYWKGFRERRKNRAGGEEPPSEEGEPPDAG